MEKRTLISPFGWPFRDTHSRWLLTPIQVYHPEQTGYPWLSSFSARRFLSRKSSVSINGDFDPIFLDFFGFRMSRISCEVSSATLNLCKLSKRKWNLPGQLALLVVEMVERFQHLVQRLHLVQELFPLEPAGEHRNLVVGQNSFLDSLKNLNWRLDWAARWCCFARSKRSR